jgi:hypothetical protein
MRFENELSLSLSLFYQTIFAHGLLLEMKYHAQVYAPCINSHP